jgi:hypothetical protein
VFVHDIDTLWTNFLENILICGVIKNAGNLTARRRKGAEVKGKRRGSLFHVKHFFPSGAKKKAARKPDGLASETVRGD